MLCVSIDFCEEQMLCENSPLMSSMSHYSSMTWWVFDPLIRQYHISRFFSHISMQRLWRQHGQSSKKIVCLREEILMKIRNWSQKLFGRHLDLLNKWNDVIAQMVLPDHFTSILSPELLAISKCRKCSDRVSWHVITFSSQPMVPSAITRISWPVNPFCPITRVQFHLWCAP